MNDLQSYKGRKVNYDKPVRVYRNLGNTVKKTWSIMQGGKVVAHADKLSVAHAIFHVNPGGHLRMLRTGHRNVHAFVIGYLTAHEMGVRHKLAPVAYDRNLGSFYYTDEWAPATSTPYIEFQDTDVQAARVPA